MFLVKCGSCLFADPTHLPDGCIDIIFDMSYEPFSAGILFGTMTRPLMFQPVGATPFLRCSANVLTDSELDLSIVWKDAPHLVERIRESADARRQIQQLQTALLSRLETVSPPDRRVEAAASIIQHGRSMVEEGAAIIGVSRQHLNRLFRQHVGIGPKCFDRVARMRRLLAGARQFEQTNWSTVALDAGYCDQAHMIAECRSLTGLTPTRLIRTGK